MSIASEPAALGSAGDLWPGEGVRRALLDRYDVLNAGYENVLIIHMKRRGFLSEVTVLVSAMLYALSQHRRLAVNAAASFNGLSWADYFASTPPPCSQADMSSVPWEQQIIKSKDSRFLELLGWVDESVRARTHFQIAALGVDGELFQAKRRLFQVLCRPTARIEAQAADAMKRLGLTPGRFAAVHLRRGDKVAVRIKNGRSWSEGENTPPWRIAAILDRLSPSTRDVLVLTDDFATVGELQDACPRRRIVTLCPPAAAGHEQDAFNNSPRDEKSEIVRRLVVECVIAAQSDAFAGGYKSNVGKFIASIHLDPARCVSTDSVTDPWLKH